MRFTVKTHLRYAAETPCDLLLQIEALSDDAQHCGPARLVLDAGTQTGEVSGEGGIGTRRWIWVEDQIECTYEATIDVTRDAPDWASLLPVPVARLPDGVVTYLMPSRYCPSDPFEAFAQTQFGHLSGGPAIRAMADWISQRFTYDPAVSDVDTTAADSFTACAGVCRDYAHVLIALARASGIPARYVSAYAPDVQPQDFHAVVEVYLSGAWHIIDPTGMAHAGDVARIGVGRDAADVSFMTSFGWMQFERQSVQVTKVAG